MLSLTHKIERFQRRHFRNYSVRGHHLGIQPAHRNIWGNEQKLISVVNSIGHFTS